MIHTMSATTALQKRVSFPSPGTVLHDNEELPPWSKIVVESNEEKFVIRAGSKDLEALVLQYPKKDD